MTNKMFACIGIAMVILAYAVYCYGVTKIERGAKVSVDFVGEGDTVSIPAEELTFGDVPTGTDFFFTDNGTVDLEIDMCSDISFSSNSGPSVDFIWDDGKFDIRFDPDKLTESAKVFCEAIGPYINEHIIEKAKELNKEKE